jgi:hypothetical protein
VLARRMAAAALAVTVTSLLGAACGDDGGGDDTADVPQPSVELIDPAVAAVENELGGPQDYFEINVTGPTVNLFVAADDASSVTTYRYLGGELLPPDPPQDASGSTFRADAIAFDPDTILERIDDELDDPIVTRFVVVGGPGGAVQYAATVTSEQGGQFDVLLAPDGTIQGVDPGTG